MFIILLGILHKMYRDCTFAREHPHIFWIIQMHGLKKRTFEIKKQNYSLFYTNI